MKCEHYQQMMSVFLDNELDLESSNNVRAHLTVCEECLKVCEDLALILDVCRLEEDANAMPPNPKALWCRINNIIESEVQAEIAKESAAIPQNQPGWSPRSWNLSLPQLASAVLGIALVSSLLTFIGIRNYSSSNDNYAVTSSQQTMFEKFLGKIGLMETPAQARARRLKEREAAIAYWNKRVETRRTQWSAHLRDAFDRNLNEIDQAVNEYTLILQENPQDELSSEMLDSALNEKVELLREFSDL